MPRAVRIGPRAIVSAMLLAGATYSDAASAFCFPEHAEISRAGLSRLPAPLVDVVLSTVREARAEGLPLCEDVRPFAAQDLAASPFCIPYIALPALAADHAADAAELRDTLRVPSWRALRPNKTRTELLTHAAVVTFQKFLREHGAFPYLEATPKPDGRAELVRALDFQFQVLDPDYSARAAESNAHFVDARRSLSEVLESTKRGELENALAQTLAHHLRALSLATHARGDAGPAGRAARTEALLEHAFALHFVEDAFAAGHLATDPELPRGDRDRTGRHDFLNRTGLWATRALAGSPCHQDSGPDACFLLHGDGYLDFGTMRAVSEAVATVQAEFALALAPDTLPLSDVDVGTLAPLLDPTPQWTLPPDRKRLKQDTPSSERDLIHRFRETLKAGTPHAAQAARVSSARQANAVWPSSIGRPLDACEEIPARDAQDQAATEIREACADATPHAACWTLLATTGSSIAIVASLPSVRLARLEAFDYAVVRPLVAKWPTPASDIRTDDTPRDAFRTGLASQLGFHAIEIGAVDPARGALGAALSGGVSYRIDGIFPGLSSRPAIEANVGIGPSAVFGVPSARFSLLSFAEVRMPLPTLVVFGLASAMKSAPIARLVSFPAGVGPYGARVYYRFPAAFGDAGAAPPFRVVGWDLEVAYIALSASRRGRTASAFVATESELRMRVGSVDLDSLGSAQLQTTRPVSISFELTGGWSLFW